VKKGDTVLVGQVVAEAAGFVSAPIHASVSGTVTDVGLYPDFQGKRVQTVVIRDGRRRLAGYYRQNGTG